MEHLGKAGLNICAESGKEIATIWDGGAQSSCLLFGLESMHFARYESDVYLRNQNLCPNHFKIHSDQRFHLSL